ncbi:MAG: site-2 protease family protein [Actinomycetota bacterium]
MTWSVPIGMILGIRVKVHVTFLVLLLLVVGNLYTGAREAIESLIWILLVFACVLVHEFSHALVGRRYGVIVEDIVLLPIGGVARMRALPKIPSEEMAVAVAGPAASLVLAVLFLGSAAASGAKLWAPSLSVGSLAVRLGYFNLVVAGFNLLPALPMDGGRVLHSILARRMGGDRATTSAAAVGRAFAVALMAAGALWNPWLLIIGVFVFLGAAAEGGHAAALVRVEGVFVGDVMVREPVALDPTDTVARAAEVALRSGQMDFPIVVDGHLSGLLGRASLSHAARSGTGESLVGSLARLDLPVLDPAQPLRDVVDHFIPGVSALPVARGEQLVGLLTVEGLTRASMIGRPGRERQGGREDEEGREG